MNMLDIFCSCPTNWRETSTRLLIMIYTLVMGMAYFICPMLPTPPYILNAVAEVHGTLPPLTGLQLLESYSITALAMVIIILLRISFYSTNERIRYALLCCFILYLAAIFDSFYVLLRPFRDEETNGHSFWAFCWAAFIYVHSICYTISLALNKVPALPADQQFSSSPAIAA